MICSGKQTVFFADSVFDDLPIIGEIVMRLKIIDRKLCG
jgi:hypothetical protein